MPSVTVNKDHRITIPREIRERHGWKPGDKLIFLDTGSMIYLVPEVPIEDLRGFLKGVEIDLDDLREEEDYD
jgi:AbrB family looped-hinge helix DNA binding protein